MLIAEDLMLLLLDDEKGSVQWELTLQSVLGGAVLVELALLGRVDQDGGRTLLSGRKVEAVGDGPLPDPLLEEAFQKIAETPRGAQSIVPKLGDGLEKSIPARLVEQGLVEQERTRWLGVIPQTLHPSVDSTHETELRRTIRAVLADGVTPDPRTAALIALLSANHTLKRVVKGLTPPLDWSSEVKARAKEIEKGNLGGGVEAGVGEAIAASAKAVSDCTTNDLSV